MSALSVVPGDILIPTHTEESHCDACGGTRAVADGFVACSAGWTLVSLHEQPFISCCLFSSSSEINNFHSFLQFLSMSVAQFQSSIFQGLFGHLPIAFMGTY